MGQWRGFEVGGRRVIVAGGEAHVLGAVTGLAQAGAEVTVLAPEVVPAITDLAERGLIRHRTAAAGADELQSAALLVLAGESTDDELGDQAAAANVLTYPLRRPGWEVDTEASAATPGEVILVGGGPGDPGLLTLAGLAALESADVIAYDRLAPLARLDRAKPHAEIVDVGKMPRGTYTPQEAINALLIDRARAGRRVVRLKGGDPFVFGRGGEEWQACAAAGIPVTVIPGVSSSTSAPAAAGVPLTHRTLTQGFAVVSGHVEPDDPRSTLDWDALGRSDLTLVVLMGLATLPAVTERLIRAGRPADTPAVVVTDATLPSMRVVRGRLDAIVAACDEAHLTSPATVIVGAVAGFDPSAGAGA